MRVQILRPSTSFLPEVDGYARVLHAHGHVVEVSSADDEVPSTSQVDLVYRFGGFLARRVSHVPEIHEYSSASTGHIPRLKNFVKSVGSCQPAGRVFTEPFVRQQFRFLRPAPFMWRDIGIDARFLQVRSESSKSFDLVYVGSISGRPVVADTLESLAQRRLRILAAGSASPEATDRLARAGVTFVGRVSPNEVPELLAQATHGLNIMPTIYPLQFQTSSKVLEYLAAGLTVVSNSYPWIRQHASTLGYDFIDLSSLPPKTVAELPTLPQLDSRVIEKLTWDSILERSNFVDFLTRSAGGNSDPFA